MFGSDRRAQWIVGVNGEDQEKCEVSDLMSHLAGFVNLMPYGLRV